jgi:hypothetical protein
MFDNIQDAIDFAKDKNDGGIPLFRYEAVEVPNSDPVAYEDTVMVSIVNKGDPKSIIERPKRPEDEKRWPEHWKAFVEGTEAPLEGIPLKEFPMLTPADIATCQRYHVRTVEDLADYPDVQLKNLGSRGTSMKKEAAKFLEYRKGPDIDALKQRIEELEKQVGDTKDDLPKRTAGNRVSKSKHDNRKQQPGRKNSTATRKNRSKPSG